MNEAPVNSPIPDNAVEVIAETWENGDKRRAVYSLDGQEIGVRVWDPPGVLTMEFGLRAGVIHGPHRTWYENGQLEHESTYDAGQEHGAARQYDRDGVLIGSYVMEHGTGLDVWFQAAGVLAESREYQDGQRHGYERWWREDNHTLWEEGHYWRDVEHGIFRRWNARGKLARGDPRYFIQGRRVTKREYVRACHADATLPPIVIDDDQPFRPPPAGVLPEPEMKRKRGLS